MAYSYNNNSGGSNNGDLMSWIVVVAALVIFWPVGLVLLFMKLTGRSFGGRRNNGGSYGSSATGPYRPSGSQSWSQSSGYKYEYRYQGQTPPRQDGQSAQNKQSTQNTQSAQYTQYTQTAKSSQTTQPGMQGVSDRPRDRKGRFMPKRRPVDLNKGKGMMVWGAILAILGGFISFVEFFDTMGMGFIYMLQSIGFPLGLLGAGLVLLVCGTQRNKKAKRFRKYLALIGKRESISIGSLAQAMPVSYHTACDDIQEMLDEGYIPTGYLDMASGRLILSDEGLQEEPEPEKEEQPTPPEDDDAILQEIRQVNDAIEDPEMIEKIDRIGEITGKILDYQRKNPNKDSQLRSFLNYYLPTTLKILKAYAQMEAQGIEGQNISAAKERIEGMMDKVVEGFEKQLDKLFQDDAMDITTDVEVLERMLDKDGLSGKGDGFQMGV
ncbi:MAG: 5-bromo-4-chloroindolyl phosphate hydrolysis family protein [Pseudoflavonifractor capillosus]|uniref:5-bromo-4-chloroindolyl phosphate hydrolysis family protein n=1 Tax=Pseudoflavonifractor capillosus TaxID=106588 RepID=UPI0023F7D4E0|nr:5-bromo-4-chloroindolyl phosphate hydrolysis family protein [Pseudoflavonifractor capillosus]MCI5929062.1 5-bromo-4-chloroindolyl phosphate hydrolysis family protein [Pseudoflavonifractor capillosus]MDY4662545.1 5-bromo-4-chloroindolyl phosphate hydrolysis family protein [Pseudoflavonifractor capillosus]